jgi:dihydrolipoamide dehydrogenase
MMNYDYQLAIIGGGPAGYVAAIRAGQLGLKTILIEEDALGGTCLNRGCIPTKALLHPCEVLHEIKRVRQMGIHVDEPRINFQELFAYKDQLVKKLRNGIKGLLKAAKVEIRSASGSFVDDHTLALSGEAGQVTAENIIIATGSEPFVPPIDGLAETGYWTSTTLLENNDRFPDEVVIIGGGVIGVECATLLAGFGKKVVLVEMMDQLLPRIDSQAVGVLAKQLSLDGVKILVGTKVASVRKQGSRKECVLQTPAGEQVISTLEILVAIGRKPRIEGLGLERLGVSLKGSAIVVDDGFRTSIPHIRAVGDVRLGSWQLAHSASAEGIAVVEQIAGKPSGIRLDVVPSCVYTIPELASVGLGETEARARYGDVRIGYFPLAACGKALIDGGETGFVKIIANPADGALLGGVIVGPKATELIAQLALAISAELTYEEIGATIHPHPTISESIMEAAHDLSGHAIHKI